MTNSLIDGKPQFKIGDVVYTFDTNRRVYAPGERSSPIYREHFRRETISGETSRSWLVGAHLPVKYPKNTCVGLYTAEQVEDACWQREHRSKIIEMVRSTSAKKMKEIADILGYGQ